ncbi:MAG: type I-C CRISPR-associated protein Cas8c/Csd1, partial [Oscillospiraceae bacterium]|nr:type I-C CRISPR-associated protein Cas8c/Csd1 [Oscillospiraceae bacterium]
AYSGSTWTVLLTITCGMIRKHYIEEGRNCDMTLDKNCPSRSYLFGRLLAVAEAAEKSTYENGQERATNAERYFEKFSNSPAETWATISKRLSPYFNRMNAGTKKYYQKIIDEIMEKFDRDEFNDNSKLEPEFLLAYSCQRKELYTKKDKDNSEEV